MGKYTPTKDTIKRRTVKRMKELGTYKVQYSQLIDIFVDMMHQYNFITEELEKNGYQVVIKTEESDGKKSPILATLENLRKDIGTYSDRLLLNPKSNNTIASREPPKKSPFAMLLSSEEDED